MPSVPAYCARCDLVFTPAGGIRIENSFDVTMTDNIVTCPQCRRPAKFIEGRFNFVEDRIELVSGPPITRNILDRLGNLVRQAESGKISKQELASRAAELHEGLGAAIAYLVTRYPKTLLFVVALVSMLKACNPEVKLDLNRLVEQVVQTVEYNERLEASDAKGKDVQNEQSASHPEPSKHGASSKQDQIAHAKTPSSRRRDVNRKRRADLVERRKAFPRRK